MKENKLTHIDKNGNAIMVDVSDKKATKREAVAAGKIKMSQNSFNAIKNNQVKKGDVLTISQIAGIMGLKNTSSLIPLCHTLALSSSKIEFKLYPDTCEIESCCTVKCTGKTGVEMEALTGVSISLLTIYDMCKAIDKKMEIRNIHLIKKTGGKSGEFINEDAK